MREEFERALCDNADLDSVARRLMDAVNTERLQKIESIQRELGFCKLIKQSLMETPDSGPYMIARAYIRMYRKKHYPEGTEILARQLMKEAMEDVPADPERPDEPGKEPAIMEGAKEDDKVESHDGTTSDANNGGIIGRSEESVCRVYEKIPERASGEGQTVA